MDVNSICFDYDATYSYFQNNQTAKVDDAVLGVAETIDDYCINPICNYVKDELSGRETDMLNIVLPNKYYEDKKVCNKLVNKLPDYSSNSNIKVLSHVEALASYFIRNDHRDGKYRIIDIGSRIIKVHDFEIIAAKFCHLNSCELKWQNSRLIKSIFEKIDDKYFLYKSTVEQRQILDRVHADFLEMHPKYHLYRIDYDSKITYQELWEIAKEWSAEFNATVGNSLNLSSKITVFYCGELAFWKTFMDNVSKNANTSNVIEWTVVLKSIDDKVNCYHELKNSIGFSLNDINGKVPIPLFEVGERLPVYYKTDKINSNSLKKVRIPIDSKKLLGVEIEYEGTVHPFILDQSSIEQNALYKQSNFHYEWIETRLEWEVDGCNNLIANFYQDSTLIYSQQVTKLKSF